jgi:hypothetical protein
VLPDTANFVYKATNYWVPEFERSIAGNDPAIGIQWPIQGEPIFSAKDQKTQLLAQSEHCACVMLEQLCPPPYFWVTNPRFHRATASRQGFVERRSGVSGWGKEAAAGIESPESRVHQTSIKPEYFQRFQPYATVFTQNLRASLPFQNALGTLLPTRPLRLYTTFGPHRRVIDGTGSSKPIL